MSFYHVTRFHCSFVQNEQRRLPTISFISSLTAHLTVSCQMRESMRCAVRYYYFNFKAELSRIYLGACLMSLKDCLRLGVNVNWRSERVLEPAFIRTSYSSAGSARPTIRVYPFSRRTRTRLYISSELDVSGWMSRSSGSTCDLQFAYRAPSVTNALSHSRILRPIRNQFLF